MKTLREFARLIHGITIVVIKLPALMREEAYDEEIREKE